MLTMMMAPSSRRCASFSSSCVSSVRLLSSYGTEAPAVSAYLEQRLKLEPEQRRSLVERLPLSLLQHEKRAPATLYMIEKQLNQSAVGELFFGLASSSNNLTMTTGPRFRSRGQPSLVCGDATASLRLVGSALQKLESRLGLELDALRDVVLACPALLGGGADLLDTKLDWLQKRLGLQAEDLRRVCTLAPAALMNLDDTLESKLRFLEVQLVLSESTLQKLVLRRPELLQESVKMSIAPTLAYLKERLELTVESLRKMVVMMPNLLCAETPVVCESRIALLEKRLTPLSVSKLRFIALSSPCVLQVDVEPKLAYLVDRLGLTQRELRHVTFEAPAVFRYSIDSNLEPKLTFLERRLGVTKDELKSIILEKPRVLGYSLEANIEPKLAFYEDVLRERGPTSFASFVFGFRKVLRTSLTKLRPRHERILRAGLRLDSDAISRIIGDHDADFDAWLATSVRANRRLLLIQSSAPSFQTATQTRQNQQQLTTAATTTAGKISSQNHRASASAAAAAAAAAAETQQQQYPMTKQQHQQLGQQQQQQQQQQAWKRKQQQQQQPQRTDALSTDALSGSFRRKMDRILEKNGIHKDGSTKKGQRSPSQTDDSELD